MSALAGNAKALVAAVAFLTRLPVGRLVALDGSDVARAALFFPLVGAGLGAMSGAIAQALAPALSPLLAASVAVGCIAVATGALHFDSIADTADALGGRTREHSLEIMRDHAIGAYGAVALILDLAVRVAALSVLAGRHQAVLAALAAGALSRASAPVAGALLPYARPGDGTGAPMTRISGMRAAGAVAIAVAVAVAAAPVDGAILVAAATGLTVAAVAVWRRWLGGVTGDVLGAGIEATELLCLVVAVALTRTGGLA